MFQLTAFILVLFPEITFEGIRLNICFLGYTTESGTSVKEFKHDPASHLDKELTKRVKLLHLENQRTDKLLLGTEETNPNYSCLHERRYHFTYRTCR
ncbi:hypothetical protein CDAR_258941 [Caerostris darwini]|uniref:Uncharacterized protein n=1 Tax=Caerostris darwini TaxID=1538125 RepID=A0AAV4PS56_9ARAC|nr:hypothetical protein CDAR_258941 [Caerostris darwini]